MNLLELERETKDIDNYSRTLFKQYQDILRSLANIYGIISSINPSQAKEIENLIDSYRSVIDIFDQYYGRGVHDLYAYINATRENVNQLTADIKATCEAYDFTL